MSRPYHLYTLTVTELTVINLYDAANELKTASSSRFIGFKIDSKYIIFLNLLELSGN